MCIRDRIYAGQTLGMSDRKIFWKVIVPAAGPGIASGTVPVSYTHLDVYKRQVVVLYWGKLWPFYIRQIPKKKKAQLARKNPVSRIVLTFVEKFCDKDKWILWFKTVSYTHLHSCISYEPDIL